MTVWYCFTVAKTGTREGASQWLGLRNYVAISLFSLHVLTKYYIIKRHFALLKYTNTLWNCLSNSHLQVTQQIFNRFRSVLWLVQYKTNIILPLLICSVQSCCFRLCGLPVLGRPERPSSGGDASVQVLWRFRLQWCRRFTRLHLRHAHAEWHCHWWVVWLKRETEPQFCIQTLEQRLTPESYFQLCYVILCRRQGNIRGWPCPPSAAKKRGASSHHQPQLICWDQRARNRTSHVIAMFGFFHKT